MKSPSKGSSIRKGLVPCPVCGLKRYYKLADNRRKCVSCGKKFTPRSRTCKLSKKQIKEIARMFWLGVPATRVAQDLGLNVKTVCKHYHTLRLRIAMDSALLAAPMAGEIEVDESYFGGVQKGKRGRGAAGKIPVFGLLKRGGEVRVVFPEGVDAEALTGAIREHVQPQSWVYSDSFRSYDRLCLDGFHHQRINHGETFASGPVHINGIENFWGYAKRRLKLYHGGFKKNFPLFLKEMEFRFNHRNDKYVVEKLTKFLQEESTGPL